MNLRPIYEYSMRICEPVANSGDIGSIFYRTDRSKGVAGQHYDSKEERTPQQDK